MVNTGGGVWNGGHIYIGQDGILRNTGTFDVQTDSDIFSNGGNGTVDNQAIFRKTAGTVETQVARTTSAISAGR